LRGYVALTQIPHQGWMSTVLTTNFDSCLNRAAIQHNRPHRLVSIATPADYVMFNSAPQDPQLIFLHGSVQHYTDKNLTAEVQTLDPALVDRLKPLLRDHPIIVRPEKIDDGWLDLMTGRLDLVRPVRNAIVPTLAGCWEPH